MKWGPSSVRLRTVQTVTCQPPCLGTLRTVAAPHVTVITFRVTWASGFPSACQDRAEQQRALWYRNLHLIHKPVGSSPPLTHPIKNQQWRYLDLELFHKQVKFAYANILKV